MLFQRAVAAGELRTATEALRNLTTQRGQTGRYDEADELAELSLEIAERAELTRATAWAFNLLAVSRYRNNDWEGAQRMCARALRRANDLGDDELIASVCTNLCVLASMQGDFREARLIALESIAASVRSGDTLRAIGAYNNLGIICTDLEELLEAELYFDRGIEIAKQLSDAPMLGMLYTNRAKPLIQVGEFGRATDSLVEAERYATQTRDAGTLSEVELHRATIARLRGDYSAAATHLDRALAHADTPQLQRERALALEGMALLRDAEGRSDEAQTLLQQVIKNFRELGAERDATRAEALLSTWNSTDDEEAGLEAPQDQ
jgi:tetratricopeptide (TPR) repeat protein